MYVFLWKYEGHDIIYACRYSNKEFTKKFWATFVEKMLRNKCICKNWHFVFANFWGPAKISNFGYEERFSNTSYLSFEDFYIHCKHKKILVDVRPCWCNIFQPEKKLAEIFDEFCGIYMFPDVPVVHHKMLLYCCQMLLMMQTTSFDNINMLKIK